MEATVSRANWQINNPAPTHCDIAYLFHLYGIRQHSQLQNFEGLYTRDVVRPRGVELDIYPNFNHPSRTKGYSIDSELAAGKTILVRRCATVISLCQQPILHLHRERFRDGNFFTDARVTTVENGIEIAGSHYTGLMLASNVTRLSTPPQKKLWDPHRSINRCSAPGFPSRFG